MNKNRAKKKTDARTQENGRENFANGASGLAQPAILLFIEVSYVLSGFAGHWDDPWVKFGCIPIFVLLASWLLYELFRRRGVIVRRAIYCAAAAAIALSSIIIVAYLLYSPHFFRVRAISLLLCDTRRNTTYSYVMFNDSRSNTITPVVASAFIQLTNCSEVAFMIDSFSVEAETGNGWERIQSIPVEQGHLYWCPNPFEANRCDFGKKYLQNVLSEKLLQPHEAIEGWLFFNIPFRGLSTMLRLRVRDTVGREMTEDFGKFEETDKAEIRVQPPAAFRVSPEKTDITEIPIKIWDGSEPQPRATTAP